MAEDSQEEVGHADDIILINSYEAPIPEPKRAFLPWHLPRKQFVRQYQWCKQINQMLDDAPIDNTLKYLGLPGVDLLDLRYFHQQICETRDINLRFLGFNKAAQPTNKAQTELNVSLDEVRRLSKVDQLSDVIGDDFVVISNPDSLAWAKACKLGPYNVINLDLCDGFGAHAPANDAQSNYYNAISQLMSLQARSMDSWLLLLTTRAGREHINSEVLEKFMNKYLNNLSSCSAFKAKSKDKYSIEDESALRGAVKTASGVLPIFLCGLCKWLVGLGLAHQPPTKVELKSVIGYRVDRGAEAEDLISLALRFTPTLELAGDPAGLTRQSRTAIDECTLATRALGRIAARKDADRILEENPEMKGAMIDAAAELLERARYDPVAYREWAILGDSNS